MKGTDSINFIQQQKPFAGLLSCYACQPGKGLQICQTYNRHKKRFKIS